MSREGEFQRELERKSVEVQNGFKKLVDAGYFESLAEGYARATAEQHAVALLETLSRDYYSYRSKSRDYSYTTSQLISNVITHFLALRSHGFVGVFAKQGWGGSPLGLTEGYIKILDDLNHNETVDEVMSGVLRQMQWANMWGSLSSSRSSAESEMTEALVFGTFCAAYIFFQFSACIAKDVDKIFNDSFDTIAFKLASLSGEDFEKYFSPALEKITNPGSLYNKKLLVLKNGLLREVENIIAGKQQSNDPIFSVFFNEAKKLDSDKSIKINWFVILKEFSLEDLSNDKILLYTLKAVIKNAKENERSRYAPLHIMTEDQQAFFIGLLKEEKCVVNFSIQYLSNLLEKASAKQGKLLIENFLIKISWIRFSTSKEMVGLVAWMRNHGDQLAPENKEKIDDVILERLERDIQKITSDGKKWDDIRLAWKSVRELSLKTPAENVYRAVVALREKDPVDVMQITKILGGFMFANPKAPFTVVLKEKYGDLFILMYFTLPAEENKQRNTIVTGAVASYESLVEKEQALRAIALENTQKREAIEKEVSQKLSNESVERNNIVAEQMKFQAEFNGQEMSERAAVLATTKTREELLKKQVILFGEDESTQRAVVVDEQTTAFKVAGGLFASQKPVLPVVPQQPNTVVAILNSDQKPKSPAQAVVETIAQQKVELPKKIVCPESTHENFIKIFNQAVLAIDGKTAEVQLLTVIRDLMQDYVGTGFSSRLTQWGRTHIADANTCIAAINDPRCTNKNALLAEQLEALKVIRKAENCKSGTFADRIDFIAVCVDKNKLQLDAAAKASQACTA